MAAKRKTRGQAMTAPVDVWCTSDGQRIPVKKLETQHLANIILWLAVNHGGELEEVPAWPALRQEAIQRDLYPYGLEGGTSRQPGAFYDLYKEAAGPMLKAMGEANRDSDPGAFYDTFKEVGAGMLKGLGGDEPDAVRAGLLPPHHLVDSVRPDGWAPIPTPNVRDILDLEKIIAALRDPNATAWIHPNGFQYVVPGRYNRDTHVTVQGNDPNNWHCKCAQSHDTTELCYPVLQVALLRGTLIRRTHYRTGDS